MASSDASSSIWRTPSMISRDLSEMVTGGRLVAASMGVSAIGLYGYSFRNEDLRGVWYRLHDRLLACVPGKGKLTSDQTHYLLSGIHMVALIEPQARGMCRGGVIVCVLAVQVDHLRAIHMLIVVLCWCRRKVGVGLFLEVQTQPKS